MLRLWRAGHRFRNVDEVVLEWHDDPARASRTDARYGSDAFARCKVHHLAVSVLRDREVVVWGAGPVGRPTTPRSSASSAPRRTSSSGSPAS